MQKKKKAKYETRGRKTDQGVGELNANSKHLSVCLNDSKFQKI